MRKDFLEKKSGLLGCVTNLWKVRTFMSTVPLRMDEVDVDEAMVSISINEPLSWTLDVSTGIERGAELMGELCRNAKSVVLVSKETTSSFNAEGAPAGDVLWELSREQCYGISCPFPDAESTGEKWTLLTKKNRSRPLRTYCLGVRRFCGCLLYFGFTVQHW